MKHRLISTMEIFHDTDLIPLLYRSCCMFVVVVLLEGKTSPKLQVTSWLEEVLVQNLSVLGPIHDTLHPHKFTCALSWKADPQHDASSAVLHCWDGVTRSKFCTRCAPHVLFLVDTKELYFSLVRPKYFPPLLTRIIDVIASKLKSGFSMRFLQKRLLPCETSKEVSFVKSPRYDWLVVRCSQLCNWFLNGF